MWEPFKLCVQAITVIYVHHIQKIPNMLNIHTNWNVECYGCIFIYFKTNNTIDTDKDWKHEISSACENIQYVHNMHIQHIPTITVGMCMHMTHIHIRNHLFELDTTFFLYRYADM